MTTLLDNNKTVEIVDANGVVLGYGFGSSGTPPADQEQRWLLPADRSKWPSRGTFIWRVPHDQSWGSITTLSGFIAKATATFVAGVNTYAKINTKHYTRWTTIPRPLPAPPPYLPPNPPILPQGDTGTLQMARGSTALGYEYTRRIGVYQSNEYWVMLPAYSTCYVGGDYNVQNFPTPESYADIMDRTTWTSACTMCIAACNYYDNGVPNPG